MDLFVAFSRQQFYPSCGFLFAEEVPEKRRKSEDEEEDQADDYEEWKRKILANAAKANAAKAEAASSW